MSAGVLVTARNRWVRYGAIAGVVTLPFVILLTQSRGAFIALLAFALPILHVQKRRKGTILLLIGALGIITLVAAPGSVWDRLSTLSDVTSAQSAAKANDEGSARQRIEIWRVAGAIVREHPILGVGLGAYPEAHYVYAQRPEFDPTALGRRDTHSTYLRLLAQTGVVGFLLFFLMLATIVRDAERTRRRARHELPKRASELFYLELGLLAYFVAGIWGSYEMMALTYLYLGLIYTAAQVTKGELPLAAGVIARRRGVRRNTVGLFTDEMAGRMNS
jgi:O-antigen ligase